MCHGHLVLRVIIPSGKMTERAQALAFKPRVSVLGCFGFNSLHSRCTPSIRAGKLAPSAEPLSKDGRCWNKRESASVGMLRHPPRAMSLRADRPFKKKIIQCEAADVVAQARAAESIGISFQNPLALAMGRFRLDVGTKRRLCERRGAMIMIGLWRLSRTAPRIPIQSWRRSGMRSG
jgi:hypothetical protein